MSVGLRERILVVWDPCRPSAEVSELLRTETGGRPASVDLVAANRPHRILQSFALSTGFLPESPDDLEAAELSDLDEALRELAALLPENLGIRSRIRNGEPCRIASELLDREHYDLVVVIGSRRTSLRRRRLARRLSETTELVLSAGVG